MVEYEEKFIEVVFNGHPEISRKVYKEAGVNINLQQGEVYTCLGFRILHEEGTGNFTPHLILSEFLDKVFPTYRHWFLKDEYGRPMYIEQRIVMFPAMFFEYKGKPLSLKKLKRIFNDKDA